MKNCYQNQNIKLVYYNVVDLNYIVYSRNEDVTEKEDMSNVVYKLPCINCDRCYIGQTRQYLKNRIKEHEYDCNIAKQILVL